jgi:hypothetical protein
MKTGSSSSGVTVAIALGMVLALAWVWGNYESQGQSPPENPRELVTTTTLSVFGRWPYFSVDSNGPRIMWGGAAIGLVCTVLVVGLGYSMLRRRTRGGDTGGLVPSGCDAPN